MLNDLDPVVELLDANGQVVAMDDNSAADGRNVDLRFDAVMDGKYTVRVTSAERHARATLMSLFARHVSPELADLIWQEREQLLSGGKSRAQRLTATVLFSDIRNFTTMSEDMGARETVSMLNDYFTEMVDVIFSHEGILDKYIGDAIMALFGTPFPGPHDAMNAVSVAFRVYLRGKKKW